MSARRPVIMSLGLGRFGLRLPLWALYASAGLAVAARFEQKPGSSLSLVDPSIEQTHASDVTMLFADAMRFSHRGCKLLVVFPKLRKHVERSNVVGVIRPEGDGNRGSAVQTYASGSFWF